MKSQEIVIRVVLEQAHTSAPKAEKAPKAPKKRRNLSNAFYDELHALQIGGTKDASSECKELGISIGKLKSRIASYVHWLNTKKGETRAYMIARGAGQTIQVARIH